jgi:23S rRNA (pseudouridine1915-N3)-methyltransferase
MRLTIIAVGRLKRGPERDLVASYHERAVKAGRSVGFRAVDLVEVSESPARDTARRMTEESIAIASVIPEGAAVVILDERGESLDSAGFTRMLQRWRDDGREALAFVIGGPDGLADSLRDRAERRLAFGAATWPHQLVRVMLLEQLYRAVTILSGHPYHRE